MAEQNSGKTKKQGFLQGAAILTFGTLLVKLIGALYKIPMNRIIGTEGFGHFNVAYSIYNVLLMISSTTSSSVSILAFSPLIRVTDRRFSTIRISHCASSLISCTSSISRSCVRTF